MIWPLSVCRIAPSCSGLRDANFVHSFQYWAPPPHEGRGDLAEAWVAGEREEERGAGQSQRLNPLYNQVLCIHQRSTWPLTLSQQKQLKPVLSCFLQDSELFFQRQQNKIASYVARACAEGRMLPITPRGKLSPHQGTKGLGQDEHLNAGPSKGSGKIWAEALLAILDYKGSNSKILPMDICSTSTVAYHPVPLNPLKLTPNPHQRDRFDCCLLSLLRSTLQ